MSGRGDFPDMSAVCGVLLAPGASAGRDHPSLVAIEAALTPLGVPVSRIDLPSRRRESAVLGVVREQASALAASAGLGPDRILLGGRSFGGRMCSMAVAAGLPALGLILVSYPLHPPGRPDNLRTTHFPRLPVPCLFVSGTRDAFGTPAELQTAAASIPGGVDHRWVEGGDHGLRGQEVTVASIVSTWVAVICGVKAPDPGVAQEGGPRG